MRNNLVRIFLFLPIAACFRFLTNLYHAMWDRGFFAVHQSPIPIVSIGNIAIGGVGKTPLTILLAQQLSKRGVRVAIASRGYLSAWEKNKVAKCVDPTNTTSDECGDEPLLIAQRCPNSPVWITKNRISSASCAFNAGSQLLLLDDGMQYRAIEKAFEIVVINAVDPLGGNAFFPLGALRDSPERLKNARLIVMANCTSKEQYEGARRVVSRYTSAPTVGFGARIEPVKFKKIAVLTAIANPQRMYRMLEEAGCEIILKCALRDHSPLRRQMITEYTEKAKKMGAEAVICTEKDHVKIDSPLKSSIPVVSVRLELIPLYEVENWILALDQMVQLSLIG